VEIKDIISYPFGPEGVQLRADQIPPQPHRPDVSFDFVAVHNSCRLVDSHYKDAILEAHVIEAGLLAAEAGYDGVVMNSVADPGLDVLRSRLTIPVIGPGQVALHIACVPGQRFSIVTMWKEWNFNYAEALRGSGLGDVLASSRSAAIHPDIGRLLGDQHDEVVARLTQKAISAVEDDHAEVIVLGSPTMHQAAGYMSERPRRAVINPGPAAVAIATVVNLGLRHSKMTRPSSGVAQDENLLSRIGTAGRTRLAEHRTPSGCQPSGCTAR
jgi:allantoin racemase